MGYARPGDAARDRRRVDGLAAHRANILDPRYRETGIGVSPHPPASLAHGLAGAIYTQVFGVIIGG